MASLWFFSPDSADLCYKLTSIITTIRGLVKSPLYREYWLWGDYSMPTSYKPRRQIAHVSVLGTTQLHLKHPWVVTWWSCAFPGFGHLLLSKYMRALLLIVWEFVTNTYSHLNEAMVYTFIGQFDKATEALELRWLALYVPVYLFAIFDSHRTTVDMNQLYVLADRENPPFISFRMNALETNYLDKRNPSTSLLWSLLMPGLGHLYLHRLLTAIVVLIMWIIVVYQSKMLISLHSTLIGDWDHVSAVLNKQWALFIPSMYGFALYDAYVTTIEINKLFARDQKNYLMQEYQNKQFTMPSKI
jgi:hypothetical protein